MTGAGVPGDLLAAFRGSAAPSIGAWLLVALAGTAVLATILGGHIAVVPGRLRPAAQATIPAQVPAPTKQPAAVPERSPASSSPSGNITRPPHRFAVPPRAGVERRVVDYRLVKLADRPGDGWSAELGRLDRGDEVEILEAADGFARVRTVDGLEGWVAALTVLRRVEPGGG